MYDTTELSKASGFNPNTIREMARNGLLPAISDDGRWVFHEDCVELLTSMAEDAEDGADELQVQLEDFYSDDEDDEDDYDDDYE